MQKIIANEEVYASNRPTELPDQWNHEGWRVDTKYHIIQNPIKTTEHMGKILELQPQENAPFNKIGKVNTGYLFFATKEMAANIIKKTAVTQAIDVEKTVLSDLADPEEQYNPATKGKSQPLYKQWEEGLSKR